ncbi:hypothetical protein [Amycolatopsis sp. NPDC059657]|uniref:hypothetical protein n=1 Tax=Amycolatopsis sp. NPDC059657 TaxID=3346899 RepID=UPI003670983A
MTPDDPDADRRATAVWLSCGAGAAVAVLLAILSYFLAFYLSAFEQAGSPDGHSPKADGLLFLLWALSALAGVAVATETYRWLRKGTR